MTFSGALEFGAITVICVLVAQLVKATLLTEDVQRRWLPVICGILGAILGVSAWVTGVPEFPATDWLSAAAVGIVSGLAATGVHQIGKQLSDVDE